MTPAVKAIIFANVAVFLAHVRRAGVRRSTALRRFAPQAGSCRARRASGSSPRTCSCTTRALHAHPVQHAGGLDVRRRSRAPLGHAGVREVLLRSPASAPASCTVLVVAAAVRATRAIYESTTIGASGAVYGLLLAWALLFPHRQILFMFIFPLPARMVALHHGRDGVPVAAQRRERRRSPKRRISAAFVVGWLYLKGPTNLRLDLSTGSRNGAWTACAGSSTSTRAGSADGWGPRIH